MTDAEKVIQLICETGVSMKKACTEAGITPWTFLRAIEKEDLAQHYTRAIDVRADTIFDEILEIADDESGDEETFIDEEGIKTVRKNKDNVHRSRLQIDARKWVLSRMNPKKYGDRMDLTSDNQPLPTPMIIMPKPTSE